jgi:hypothetical protein
MDNQEEVGMDIADRYNDRFNCYLLVSYDSIPHSVYVELILPHPGPPDDHGFELTAAQNLEDGIDCIDTCSILSVQFPVDEYMLNSLNQ